MKILAPSAHKQVLLYIRRLVWRPEADWVDRSHLLAGLDV